MKLCDYIFKRLFELGIGNVFCIPGESVQDLYRSLLKSKVKSVLLSHEPSIGYAADAYSRLKGLGAVLVSYGVGSLNLVNAVSQAYAESSPMLVLSGGPGMAERKKHSLLHHKVRTFQSQQKVFEEITAASIIIDSANNAAFRLEEAFQIALKYKKPVYIEIPRDICNCEVPAQPFTEKTYDSSEQSISDQTLTEALDEIVELINSAKNPVVLAGVEIARIKKQKELLKFIDQSNLPVASTLLGKSVIPESHPLSLGTFFGTLSNQQARKYVEGADLIIALGAILSDVNLGMFTFQLNRNKLIEARIDHLKIKNHLYPELTLDILMDALASHPKLKKRKTTLPTKDLSFLQTKIESQPISTPLVGLILNQFINHKSAPAYRIVSDVGDCLFIGQELFINRVSSFLSPAYYLSMGFAVPGGIGAQIADPTQRSLILVGDGAFQMTGLEILSATRLGLNPIIILLNNGIYATLERVELEPIAESYNIGNYQYFKMAEIFGGVGCEVKTTNELQEALKLAETTHKSKLNLIQVNLSPEDVSDVLKSFGAMMGKSNQLSSKSN